MGSRKLSKSIFGAPADFGGAQLPTYQQVGKQFLKTKNDLRAIEAGKRILDLEVAKKVFYIGPQSVFRCVLASL